MLKSMKYKVNKTFLLVCIIGVMDMAFAVENPNPDFSAAEEFTIPFEFDAQGFPAIEAYSNGRIYRLEVNLAYKDNVSFEGLAIKKNGEEALDHIYDSLRSTLAKEKPWMTDEELDYSVRINMRMGMAVCVLEDLNIGGRFLGNVFFPSCFVQPGTAAPKDIDGIIGMSFFSQSRNLVIDFKNRLIKINTGKISETGSPIRRLRFLNMYATIARINGREQDVLISFCNTELYLRDDYASPVNYSNGELMAWAFEGVSVHEEYEQNQDVIFELCGIQKAVRGIFVPSVADSLSKEGKRLVRKINIVGMPFFMNRCIQFDFENGQFRIV